MKIGKSHKNRMTWQYQLTASQQWKLPVGVLHWTYCKSNVHHSSLPRKERVVTSQLQLQWIGLVKHRVPLNSLLLITIPIENAMWQRRISAFQAHPNIRLSVIYIYRIISRLHLRLPSGYLTVRHGKSPFLIGKPSINGPFSMAMLNNQRVDGRWPWLWF